MHMRRVVVVLLGGLLLGGCSWFGGGKAEFDLATAQRAKLQQLAEQGDIEAEYRLGLSYCCGYGPGHSRAAQDWLCKAALQGHAGAQFQLGQQFGFRTKSRPMSSVLDYADYAHFWYSLAAAQGNALADTYRVAIEQDMDARKLARSHAWQTDPKSAGC